MTDSTPTASDEAAQNAALQKAVIVGIQPQVAFALVQLPRGLDVHTALDLEEGLAHLELATTGRRAGNATLEALDEHNTTRH